MPDKINVPQDMDNFYKDLKQQRLAAFKERHPNGLLIQDFAALDTKEVKERGSVNVVEVEETKMTDKINVPQDDERMPQKSVMQWAQEWYKLVQGGETSRPSVYPIRIEGLEHRGNGPQEFTVEFMYTGRESSALEAVNAALKGRGIVNVAEVKETKMTKNFKENAEEFQDCNRYRNLINVYHDAVAAVDGCNGCAYTLKDDECIYAPPCSKSERLDGLPKIWVLSKDQSPKHYTNFESKESIMKQQVNVEVYESLYEEIEKESYTDNDDEFDKACVQVSAKASIEELEAEIAKLQKEQDKRQQETDALVLELRQYVERYRNANTRAIAAEMEFAEFVRTGVLKRTAIGYEPALSREHIDETVFMCKIRANRMAEALHKYKYQKNNAYANDKDREAAETEYMTALQLFNDSFSAL